MNNNHLNIQKSSGIAFCLVAAVIITCSTLIGYNLNQQVDMLQASGISYEQRILLERTNEQVHLLLDETSNAQLSDRIILKLRDDISNNAKLINKNQKELHKLLLEESHFIYEFGRPFDTAKLSENLKQIDSLWALSNDRTDKISSASVTILRAGYRYWQPVDTLLAHNGLLFNSMADLNNLVYQASLKQNTEIRILYSLILFFALTGLWLIWRLTLRPLSKRLAENYREIMQKNDDLEFQATHDPMTQLSNRAAFNRKMLSLNEEKNGIGQSSLILMDVDEFKSINDNLGHQVGDKVLIKISNIMQEDQLATESVYRLGGDEFAIVIDEVRDRNQLVKRLEQLVNKISLPTYINDVKVNTSCSLGVAWGNKCGNTPEEAFSAADTALYKVKENGGNHFQLFDEMSDQSVSQLLQIEDEIRRAVKEKQFIVHYQPIVHLETGELDSLEALARWQHPERGELLPKDWLATADRLGLSSDITLQIMDRVESDYHNWKNKGLAIRTVHINITEQMLVNGVAYKHLTSMLKSTSLNSGWLGVEVTESIVFDRAFDKIQQQLIAIHNAGIKISLDDFGTGFANLSHLRKIPFDSLKIDQSFTAKILDDPGMYLIVKSLIDLSVGLNKRIICEGIEAPEIRQALFELGCTYSQGFLHNKGLPFEKSCSLLSPAGEA